MPIKLTAKKTILILCDWFLPGYLAGGPIQSIATLTQYLGSDIDFKIITTDRDLNSDKPYAEVKVNTWTNFKGRDVFYVSPENMNATFLLKLIRSVPADTIYLNSLFSKYFTVFPLKWKQKGLLKANIVLAPRGMLRDGALAIKPFKKQIFLRYAKTFGLFKNIRWQSTSAEETIEIKKRINSNVTLTEVSNFPTAANEIISIEKKVGELKLIFVARILGIKNLDFAIDVLRSIKTGSVIFNVYGPIEDKEYWQMCETKASHLTSNISFKYKGVLESEKVGDAIDEYHALFLPTQTENFGHVIVQSLTHGRPVIISDNTPWRELEKHVAGFDISLTDKVKFVEAIEQLISFNQTRFNAMSESSAVFINSKLNIEKIKQSYFQMFGVK